MRSSKLSFLLVAALLIIAIQPSVRGAVGVTITPGSQVVPQFGAATYAISLPGPTWPGSPYSLSISGLGIAFPFSPNPVTPPATSTLTIDLSSTFACPGTYPFTVTATNATGHGMVPIDTGTGTATLTIVQSGPPLQVSVSTDKPAYLAGDLVTISVSVTRLAVGQVRVTGPSGFSPRTYTFQTSGPRSGTVGTFTAGQPFGTYTVSVQANDGCGFINAASTTFTVSPDTYQVTVSLSGVPSQFSATLQADGQNQGSIQGSQPKTLSFKINTAHLITVDQYVAGDTGVQYYCSQNSWSVSSADSHTFDYQTQYKLTVITNPNGITPVTGDGWYAAGASVQTNQVPATVPGSAGTQYSFMGWEVDGVAQLGNGISLTMDKPHEAVAKYETQYQLVIDSPYGDPKGQGYYAADSTATFSVTTPWSFPVQQIFVRWEGDYTGTQPQGSITMDEPHIIHAVWNTSYIPLIAIVVAAVAGVGGFLFWRKRHGAAPETKPTPEMPGETGEVAVATVKCHNCQTENEAGQKFCTNCGETLTHRRKRHT